MVKNLREIYQIKVQLKGIRPPIWRRVLISDSVKLDELHHTIQIVMGWHNCHLHQFITQDGRYGMKADDFDSGWEDDLVDESKVKIKDVFSHEGDSVLYEYDFGDGWEHKITLEKILPFDNKQILPCCVKGKRGCPPEDVGGIWGYEEFIEKWVDENHPEHEDMRGWAEDFQGPEYFDLAETNQLLHEMLS